MCVRKLYCLFLPPSLWTCLQYNYTTLFLFYILVSDLVQHKWVIMEREQVKHFHFNTVYTCHDKQTLIINSLNIYLSQNNIYIYMFWVFLWNNSYFWIVTCYKDRIIFSTHKNCFKCSHLINNIASLTTIVIQYTLNRFHFDCCTSPQWEESQILDVFHIFYSEWCTSPTIRRKPKIRCFSYFHFVIICLLSQSLTWLINSRMLLMGWRQSVIK